MSKPVMITWTEPMFKRFKAAYAKECQTKGSDDSFMFDNHEFVIGYAKYLIEYLETKFPPPPPAHN